MDCKNCQHLKRSGRVARCELCDTIVHYGEIGNEPLVKDCGNFKPIEIGRREKDLYCHWRPIKKIINSHGNVHFLLSTDCHRLIDYGEKTDSCKEIEGEVCTKCKRLIKVHYIGGMGE